MKRTRHGHLFQGRYKAILADADAYATELSRYIHLNPVRAGVVARPEDYEWSSYRQYVGLAKTLTWLKASFILGCFSGEDAAGAYRKFVNDALNEEGESPLKQVVASTVLGSPEFIREISRQHLAEKQPDRNVPAVKKLSRPTLEEMISAIDREMGAHESPTRNVSIYFCHRYSGARLREIGERFGLSGAAVSQASRRVRVASEKDEKVRDLLERIAKKVGV